MTHLITSITADNEVEARDQINRALADGADMIELRLDMMEGICDDDVPALCKIAAAANVPILLTLRSTAEGGHWDGSDMDRLSRLIALGPAADYIDIELTSWQRSANLRQKVALALGRAVEGAPPTQHSRRLILSRHDPGGRPKTLQADLLAMLSEPACDVAKIAWRARTVRDNFEAFELMRSSPRPILAICMGEAGLASRVLAKKFGAFGSFSAVAEGMESAGGQIAVSQMRRHYRWDRIGPATHVLGLIGDPVSHSIGPHVHNATFDAMDEDAVYIPFHVAAGYESFKAFMVEVLARPWLDARGFSVTVPHKENALRFVHESGGTVAPDAVRWGAVNTLILGADGSLAAANTDGPALLACATELLQGTLKGRAIAILGAGGMGRTAAAVMVEAGAIVTIFNRTAERADAVASQWGCRSAKWDDRRANGFDLLINCTSVGLHGQQAGPSDAQSPLPQDQLHPETAILDTVYRPGGTPLANLAIQAGCRCQGGDVLFRRQASAQQMLWLGRNPPDATLRAAVESALAGPV